MRSTPAAPSLASLLLASLSFVAARELDTKTDGGVIFVDLEARGSGDGSTWADAFPDLQGALVEAALRAGLVQVWVAEGTYRPAGPGAPRSAHFALDADVSLFGGFAGVEAAVDERDPAAHPTVLSGDLLGDDGPGFAGREDNAFHVLVLSASGPVTAETQVDGLIIRGGHADGLGDDAGGGGLLSFFPAVPALHACVLEDNYARIDGGAVQARRDHMPPFFPGIEAPVEIDACVFWGNRADARGSAASLIGPFAVVDSIFTGHPRSMTPFDPDAMGFVVDLGEGSSGALRGCTFNDNDATALQAYVSSIDVENCLFSANRSGPASGSAINVTTSECRIANTSIAGNETFDDGLAGAISGALAHLQVVNSIVQDGVQAVSLPGPDQGEAFFFSDLVTDHVLILGDVVGNWSGEGAFTADPLFVDAAGGDFRLSQASPARDAGGLDLLPAGLTADLDGAPRVVDGNGDGLDLPDLGAFEGAEPALPAALVADVLGLSVSMGGTQVLSLGAGAAHAGELHLMLGSLSGTLPGIDLGAVHLALVPDAYTLATLGALGLVLLPGGIGSLDASGSARASLKVPAGAFPSLAGLELHHAFVTLDTHGALGFASNAVPSELLP